MALPFCAADDGRYSGHVGIRVVILCVGLASAGWPQQQPEDPLQVLIQLRHRVADRISSIPRYLCTEVVERQTRSLAPIVPKMASCTEFLMAIQKPKKKPPLLFTDRLRMDVTVLDNEEAYSWVGEDSFGDQSLRELVKTGLTATGSFSAFLHGIFASDAGTFSFLGEEQANGRRVLKYGFRVALPNSGYTVSNSAVTRTVGFSGTFSADAQTLDLLKLEVQLNDIPPELNICDAVTTLVYNTLRINSVDFLLPAEVTTSVLNRRGVVATNRTVFSSCHQFMGESKLSFDDQPATNDAQAGVAEALALPTGVTVYAALNEKIDPASSAAGDPITGRLTRPLSIPGSAIDIPQGAVLHGHVCQLLLRYGFTRSLQLGLRWENVEFGGTRYPLQLALDEIVPGTAKTDKVYVKDDQLTPPNARDRMIGYFLFRDIDKKYQIPAGFESRWITFAAH